MKTYRKDDVETHGERYNRTQYPAVNVKCYSFPSCWKIADYLKCTPEQAEKAGEFAFESAQEQFWENVQAYADECFGKGKTKVYSAGRSGGWAVVEGLPTIESWDAIQLGKWRKFETGLKSSVKYLTSFETFAKNIESNRWHEIGAEKYNFLDTNGETACIVDLKQSAISKLTVPERQVAHL